MAQRVFDNAALSPEVRDAVTIAKWIVKTRSKKINRREIHRSLFNGKLADVVSDAMEELQSANWIVLDSGNDTVGRPRTDYLVNPKIQEALK